MSKTTTWIAWNRNPLCILVCLALVALLAVVVSIACGAVHISLKDELLIVLSKLSLTSAQSVDFQQAGVLWNIRLPRILTGFLVGGVLAASGACLQGLFRNPLADPGLVGVSSGAALAAVAVIVFGHRLIGWDFHQPMGFVFLPFAAFMGGIGATFLIYRIATIGGEVRVAALLLAGIALNALSGAGIGWMSYLATDDQLRMLTFWSLGSFGGSNWSQLKVVAPLMIAVLVLIPFLARGLNALSLGEAEAGHLGFSVTRLKRYTVILSALGVGAAVAVSGVIGFVGLVAPHILRLLLGADHRWVLPGSIILGGGLVVTADLFSRIALAPAELPIGIVIATVGAPFFIYLMIREKSRLLS